MTFTLDGTDYSDKVVVTGYRVLPTKVYGSSRGDLLDGGHIADMIHLRKNLEISFVAMAEADVSAIATKCCQEYVTLGFSDPISGTSIIGVYEPILSSLDMAIDSGYAIGDTQNRRYWYSFSVTFEQSETNVQNNNYYIPIGNSMYIGPNNAAYMCIVGE